MQLSARMLNGMANVNTFEYAETIQASEGTEVEIYFQLTDASKMPSTQYFYPTGLRYMPASGATLQCRLTSIDDSKTVTRYATQPYPTQDPSIWKLTLLSTDTIVGTMALGLTLVEGSVTRRGTLQGAVQIGSSTQSFC
jgi:hypothetical protein